MDGEEALLLARTQRDDIAIDKQRPFTLPPESMRVFRADSVAQPPAATGA